MGWPWCTTLPLWFVFLLIIDPVYCTWKNLQVFSALEDNTLSNPFLWRATAHSVEDCMLLIPLKRSFPTDRDCGENHHRCPRIRLAAASRREMYGSSVAQWFFPGSSHSSRVQSLTQAPVGESGCSKWITTQVQFRTGLREALVTLIIVRECPTSTSPSAPLSFPSGCRHWYIHCFKKKKGGEENWSFLC